MPAVAKVNCIAQVKELRHCEEQSIVVVAGIETFLIVESLFVVVVLVPMVVQVTAGFAAKRIIPNRSALSLSSFCFSVLVLPQLNAILQSKIVNKIFDFMFFVTYPFFSFYFLPECLAKLRN